MSTNLLFLLTLLCPIVLIHSKEQDTDNLNDTDNLLNTYLPVNALTPDLQIIGSLPQKIQMRATVFNVAFNAAKCNTGTQNSIAANHTVIVSFLEDWSSEKILNTKDLFKNAFVISRQVDVEERWMNTSNCSFGNSKLWTRDYPYQMQVYHNGHLEEQVNSFYRFSMYNADFQLKLEKDSATIMKRRYPSENYAYENFMDFDHLIRYTAIFANYMERCETFISAVGESSNSTTSPFWVRKLGLPKNLGIPRKQRGDPEAELAVHYVQFAFFAVFLFTALLSKVIVPTYMELTDGDSAAKVNILNLNYEDNETAEVDEKPPTSGRESLAPAAEVSQRVPSIQQLPTAVVPSNIMGTPKLTRMSPGDKPEKTQEMSMSRKKKEPEAQAEKTQEESSRRNSVRKSIRNNIRKPENSRRNSVRKSIRNNIKKPAGLGTK